MATAGRKKGERRRDVGGGNTGRTPGERPVCMEPEVPLRVLPADLAAFRMRLIRVSEKKWANGTQLKYFFFDQPTDGPQGGWVGAAAQKDVVRRAFQHWKDVGLGLEFHEVSAREEAEIRIGFLSGDGAWSYVGRDVIDVASDPNERTMNLGWDLTTDYGWHTALHEIGHTLGFPHEHQNPNAGIEWNEDAVIQYFSGPPNEWPEEAIRWNILRKLPAGSVSGSEWDPDSVMHYHFPAGLIREPAEYACGLEPELGLSDVDIEEARHFYPALDEQREKELRPFESQRLMVGPGEQVDFVIRPKHSRRSVVQTFGHSDTVMVLFEREGELLRYLDGDDDSGYDRNARIEHRLLRGREYVLRVRLYFSHIAGETAVFLY